MVRRDRQAARRFPGGRGVAWCLGAALAVGFGVAPLPARQAAAQAPAATAVALDPAVADALRRMSATLAGAPSLTVLFTQLREVPAQPDGDQMLTLGATAAVGMRRPDGLAALVGSDRGSYRLWFDGSTLALLNLTADVYARAALPGDIEVALDALESQIGVEIPVGDLLAADPFAALTEPGTTGRRIGRSMVQGEPCEHFALRNATVDWQVWIAAEGPPLPCRLVVTDRAAPGRPRTVLEFQGWSLGAQLDAATFAFTAPEGAAEVPWLARQAGPLRQSDPTRTR